MADMTHKFQAPKGTRDFYPQDMAVRRYIESVWRQVSINHGFEEIDGPTFEHLELYTTKSGDEIVSQLFSFRRAGGDTDYALRPEFTPTLARMYAARAGQLPKPTKWFCMPSFFRAERPQRGRLREFFQWNIDVLGDDSPRADAEVIACVIDVLKAFGLGPDRVKVKISNRDFLAFLFTKAGLDECQLSAAFTLLDRKDKLSAEEFAKQTAEHGIDATVFDRMATQEGRFDILGISVTGDDEAGAIVMPDDVDEAMEPMLELQSHLESLGVDQWCKFDHSIVRGLAYYTGTVFEVHETTGKERAIAGGGRYDGLVELFGGPKTPAVGIAMGDVVLRLMLEERGLLPNEAQLAEQIGTRPDVFVISAKDETDSVATRLISQLRSDGLHVRQSYRSTRNVGKLLGEAAKCNARFAAILGDEWPSGQVQLKDMESGEQNAVPVDGLATRIRPA